MAIKKRKKASRRTVRRPVRNPTKKRKAPKKKKATKRKRNPAAAAAVTVSRLAKSHRPSTLARLMSAELLHQHKTAGDKRTAGVLHKMYRVLVDATDKLRREEERLV